MKLINLKLEIMRLINFLKKLSISIKIWLFHVVIYYTTTNFFLQYLTYLYQNWTILKIEFLLKILAGPIAGIIGFFDNFPLFVLIPITIYNILLLKFKLKHHTSYYLSIIASYLIPYIYNFIFFNTKISFYKRPNEYYVKIDLIFILLPSLIISILLNWLIFRKIYKKLSDEK